MEKNCRLRYVIIFSASKKGATCRGTCLSWEKRKRIRNALVFLLLQEQVQVDGMILHADTYIQKEIHLQKMRKAQDSWSQSPITGNLMDILCSRERWGKEKPFRSFRQMMHAE